MLASTRFLGATALAFVALVLLTTAARAESATCFPKTVWIDEAARKGAPVVEWTGGQAGIVFAELLEADFPTSGDSIIAVPTTFGVMIGVVDQGVICRVFALTIDNWWRLRRKVEGMPV